MKIREGNNLLKATQLISVFLRFWDFSTLVYKAAEAKWKKQTDAEWEATPTSWVVVRSVPNKWSNF